MSEYLVKRVAEAQTLVTLNHIAFGAILEIMKQGDFEKAKGMMERLDADLDEWLHSFLKESALPEPETYVVELRQTP